MPIKAPDKRRLIGRDTLAVDIPSKVDGKGRYGLDAVVEGMVYARPKVPPTRYDSKVVSIDDSAAKRVPGYLKSLALDDPSGTVPGWVMVFAESFIAANKAADLVKVKWSSGKAATVSEADIQNRSAELIADPKGGSLLVDDPGVDAALASAKQKIERTYTTSTVMHFALEPVNALAFEKDGIFEIHTGNQWQTLMLPVLAKALGRSQDKIVMRSYLLGGGFGRRLDGDYAVPAALAAQGDWQACQDGLHARGRHALRLSAVPFDAGGSHGLGRRRPRDGDGSSCGGWVAHRCHGSVFYAEGRQRRSVRSVRHRGRRPLVHGRSAAGSRAAKRSGRTDVPARLAAIRRRGLDELGCRKFHGRGCTRGWR